MSFVKGQPVTYLQNWDHQGTVRIYDLIVHSCGKKQMILVDGAGVKFQGRNFLPGEFQHSGRVVTRLSDADAEVAALQLGAEIVNDERARMERALAHWAKPETDGYTIAMRQSIAKLHEPRALRATQRAA